ncbi:hypothetical protein FSP39_012324 [Pinctada imbricata]|uniref:SANTA domain-containing protein n=1 Tax=Pinctada imbricata TaxID=66713 RepID=A0AA88XWH7_PINIB|nr:hypothetical protein FSP39_012324 [Pinctada imbricata]
MSSESGRGSRQFFTPPPQMMLQRSHLTEHSLPLYHPNHYYSREFLHPNDISWRRRDHYTRKDRPQFLTPQPQLIRSNTDLGDVSVVSDRGFPYQSNTIYDTANDYSYLVRRPQRPARGDYHHPSQMPSFDINDSHITNDIDDDTVISSVSEHINRNKREHLNSRKSQSPEPGLENSALNGLRYRGHNYVRNESRPYVDAGALDHMYMECPLENPIGKTSISKGPFWNNNDLNIDDEVVRVGRICGSDIRPGVEILGKPIRDEVQPVQEVHSLNVENIASIRKRHCYVDMVPLTPSACSKYYSQNNTSQPLTKENVERHDKMVNLTPEDEQVSNSTASLDLPDGEMDYIGVDQRIHQSMKENSSCGSKHSDPDQLSLTVPRGDSIERNSSLKEASAQHGILTNFDIENPGGNDGVTEEKDNMSTIKSLYNIEPIDVNLQVQNEEEVTDKTMLAEESEKDNSDTDNKVYDNMEAVEEEDSDVETAQYDNSPQKLYNWIIKMVPQVKGVCVEGKRRMDDEHYWETGVVIKRHSHFIVENKSGHQYRLMGDIDMEDVDCGGFDNKTITKFVNGFPDDWMKVITNFYKSKDQTQKSDSDVKGKGKTRDMGSLKVNKETKCKKKKKLKNEGKENKKQRTDKSTKLKEQQIVKQNQKITQEPKGNKNLVKDNKKSQNIVKQKAIDLVPKETQRTVNTQKKTCILKEWIIKPLSHCQGICVEGKLRLTSNLTPSNLKFDLPHSKE